MMPQEQHAGGHGGEEMARSHYAMLVLNVAISAVIMYFLMFAMIDRAADLFNNLNTFYMALMMAAPMGILMLLMMGPRRPDRRLNLALHAGFALIFVASFLATRAQAGIGDRQFLRSMIPHHSGAVLMCEKAKISDPEILSLCQGIISSQTSEIDQMKAILDRK